MAERVYTTPLLDKLGVLPGARIGVVGDIDPGFVATLYERTEDVTVGMPLEQTDVILLAADTWDELAALRSLRPRIRQAGAIWVVSRKGRAATLRDVDVMAAARDAELVDNKVASFSDTHTALRLVIPRASGRAMGLGDQAEGTARALRLGAVVLAAGAGSRFGGRKLAALLNGRPLLQHVLDTLEQARLTTTVVVLPPDASGLEHIEWYEAVRVVNPDPSLGLSSSVRMGLAASIAQGSLDAVFLLLGDQPLTAVSTLTALSRAAIDALAAGALAVLPDYADGGGANPVLLLRAGFSLAQQLDGDRGLGSVLTERADQVHWVPLAGSNPDVDTIADLRALETRS